MIPHGVILKRHPAPGAAADTLGTEAFWAEPLHQMYAQMPFSGLFRGLEINVWHERNTTLEAITGPSLLDYDPATPGDQRAVGLHWPGTSRIDLLVTASWPPDRARGVLSHEFGHWYQHACGLKLANAESTPARRALRSWWDAYRPQKGHNTYEDWAECYRFYCGDDRTRNTFSDGVKGPYSPQHQAFMRGAYWFSFIQDNVVDFEAGPFYLIWRQELPWWRSEWRYLDTQSFTLYAWRNNTWTRI